MLIYFTSEIFLSVVFCTNSNEEKDLWKKIRFNKCVQQVVACATHCMNCKRKNCIKFYLFIQQCVFPSQGIIALFQLFSLKIPHFVTFIDSYGEHTIDKCGKSNISVKYCGINKTVPQIFESFEREKWFQTLRL